MYMHMKIYKGIRYKWYGVMKKPATDTSVAMVPYVVLRKKRVRTLYITYIIGTLYYKM